jgi:UDP-2,4-diacetamido-2,4,6-trideoxy-beta-L-altropyranose hydrolase
MGVGHVIRCLTLAEALRDLGARCEFICRKHEGHAVHTIQRHGFVVLEMVDPISPEADSAVERGITGYALEISTHDDAKETLNLIKNGSFDWLIVDHYDIDLVWERRMRTIFNRIMVIDDLANRAHDCDILLDQNHGRRERDYIDLVPEHCETLIGPMYSLLRPQFSHLRSLSLNHRFERSCREILVTMGGVDYHNATTEALRAIEASDLPKDSRVTIVLGSNAPWKRDVLLMARQMRIPTRVVIDATNMAQLMSEADLAIGAAGSTTWERCCMGLPTIQTVLAENQRGIADALSKDGTALVAEGPQLAIALRDCINQLVHDQAKLRTMSKKASALVDGLGAQRVARRIMAKRV